MNFAQIKRMTYYKFRGRFNFVRDYLNETIDQADEILAKENELILRLYEIDQNRYFVHLGYKSLRGFCTGGLRFSETQSQRLVTRARRYVPTPPIGKNEDSPHEGPALLSR